MADRRTIPWLVPSAISHLPCRTRYATAQPGPCADAASDRSFSPPCDPFPPLAKGGSGGVMREPRKSKTILLALREECERTEREKAWEDLVTGRAGTTPPCPPFARGGKRRNEIGMKAQLVQDQLFTSPGWAGWNRKSKIRTPKSQNPCDEPH